ncbi:serine hydrolase [Paenibacillus sp. 481]|uniref:serine hydrolase n=1 Tax=Paenibacillus sp. 481 TaxID=2835869 RepID=UPI001E39361F|nr:serine hydrolase [Paenibacillus sp. 481]UHA73807.1 serine hydrolase [Paenibacillus sp. 481]
MNTFANRSKLLLVSLSMLTMTFSIYGTAHAAKSPVAVSAPAVTPVPVAVAVPTSTSTPTPTPTPTSPASASKSTLATHQGPIDPKEVEVFADRLFKSSKFKHIPGAVFVVVKDGKVVLSKGYGYADMNSKQPMDPEHTVLRVASISKPFASTAIMQLAEQGKVDLKKDIKAYLGDITIPRKAAGNLTLAHLMSYSTGFDFPDAPDLPNRFSTKQYLKHVMPTVVRTPGETYMYDNFGFALQGYIVEKVTGVPFIEYGQQHVLNPLGMTNSGFEVTPKLKAKLATSYNSSKKVIPYYEYTNPTAASGGLVSTGNDMAKFMNAFLQKGAIGNKKTLLTPESVKQMLRPQVAIHPQVTNTSFGFETYYHEAHNGQYIIGKGGDLPGFSSWMWMLPEQNTGAFVIFNTNDGVEDHLRHYVFKSFMDHYYPQQSVTTKQVSTKQQDLAPFEGSYRELRIGFILSHIKATADGQLEVSHAVNGKTTYRQVEPLLFVNDKGEVLAFKKKKDGSIGHMYNGLVAWSEKLEKPTQAVTDVAVNHPYYRYILDLNMRGAIQTDNGAFKPNQQMTRAEFVSLLIQGLRLKQSNTKVQLTDVVNHTAAKDIQTAIEWGIITADKGGKFYPNEVITRQEAAATLWRISNTLLGSKEKNAALRGKTDAWALPGVKFIVASKKYGPEIKPAADGTVDFESKRALLRQEGAALISSFLADPF